jgi:hypothetical protein
VNRKLAACQSWIHPRIAHTEPVYYHVVSCLSYHPANYTGIAGSLDVFLGSDWGSCNRPGLVAPSAPVAVVSAADHSAPAALAADTAVDPALAV